MFEFDSTTLLLLVSGVGAILAGLKVIGSTNPVHSIFALVMAFGFSCIMLVMIGADFLALLFMIVYVGAIAILFLFVVMMLNIRLVELIDNATRYVPIGFIIGITLLGELVLVYDKDYRLSNVNEALWTDLYIREPISKTINIKALGEYLYTEGWPYFMVAGMILLVAMIGAIVLTLHHSKDIQRQDIFGQVVARVNEEVLLRK